MKKLWKSKLTSCKGETLVELIVTFAVISIFLTSATMVLGAYFRVFTYVREYGNQKTLATTLLDTMEYELGQAASGSFTYTLDGTTLDLQGVEIASDSNSIFYKNQENFPIRISLNDKKYLNIEYQSKNVDNQNGSTQGVTTEPKDWYYGSGVYNGNIIQSLTFNTFEPNLGSETKYNYIKIVLKLKQTEQTNMTYTASRIVRCYNLTGDKESTENRVTLMS